MREYHLQSKRHKKKRKRSENGILLGSIILCVVTLFAITICLMMVFKYRAVQMENAVVMDELEAIRMDETVTYTQSEVDAMLARTTEEVSQRAAEETQREFLDKMKEFALSDESTTAMFRYFYPNEIVLADAGEYYFFPISDELRHNTYSQEQFVLDEDRIMAYYDGDGRRISHKGIDVSRYQGEIDWEKVAQDEVEYAFIRLGIRGYTEGAIQEDEQFEKNIRGARNNDIAVGVYFFTQATSVEEAEEEAQYVLDKIAPYKVDYPVVIDVEAVANRRARTRELTKEERTQYCIAFCEKIRAAGYTPMIYGNLKTFMLMLDLEQLEDYDKWFANYDDRFYYPYDFKIWQYTDEGSVDGIDAAVDLNISFEDPTDE